jgi:hypothetical protein
MPMNNPSSKRIKRLKSGRGRPRLHAAAGAENTDLGTPELILKRAHHLTSEPIDLCLKREIISPPQHRAALHLRWLHTLRFGAPSLTTRSITPLESLHSSTQTQDPVWRATCEQEYQAAIQLLAEIRAKQLILPCVLYNEWPAFLRPENAHRAMQQPHLAARISQDAQSFAQALDALAQYFKRCRSAAD